MYTVKKSAKKDSKEKYIKKNYISSPKKNIYKPTSLKLLNTLPILSQNNFIQITNEFDLDNQSEKSFTQKIEILDDGSVCKKNTKHTTRIPSPSFGERYFELDNNNNSNFILSENINKINNEEKLENNYNTFELNNIINEELIYNSGMKYNKSLPNIRTFTYTKNKAKGNFIKNKNKENEIYIKHKPYNSSGKNKINIKSEKINYKRALFNKNENFDFDIINQWKYLSNKIIINYNQKILKSNMQMIIQNLKINQILKKKKEKPTNLIHIINQQKENSDLLNKNFFDLVEQKLEKNDKINKYKGNIESINEEMNESFEEQDEENKRNSLRSNKSKQIKIKKRINELEIKEIESINFSPLSSKSKDIKLFFNKNIQDNNSNDIFFIYKKIIDDKKRIKLLFNENKENKENINNKYNINIKSYKKILKMAFYDKNAINNKKTNLTKDKYESLIHKLINNIIIYKVKYKNKNNLINNNNDIDIDKKIIELENNVKGLKEIYIYGINKIRIISNENDKNNFIKKLNLTNKRNNVKKIYKEIMHILKNNNIDEKYYQNIIDKLKQYEKIEEYEIKKIKKNRNKRSCINIIKFYFIFLPLIFALNYFTNNLKKI